MPKTKVKPQRRVDVHWRDAHAPAPHASYSLGEIPLLPSFKPMITTGWLLEERADAVVVAGEYCPEDDDYRGITIVPRELLIGVTKQGQKIKMTKFEEPGVPLQFTRTQVVGEEVV